MHSAKLILLAIILTLTLLGCENNMVDNEETNALIHHELGVLPKLTSLPRDPISVKWQVIEENNTQSGYLTAALAFTPEDYQYIIDNSAQMESAKVELEEGFYNEWIPDIDKQNSTYNDSRKTFELTGTTPLKPDLFTQTEFSPFLNGKLISLKKEVILLSLYSM